jgi:LysR family hca operon transcriptional activator
MYRLSLGAENREGFRSRCRFVIVDSISVPYDLDMRQDFVGPNHAQEVWGRVELRHLRYFVAVAEELNLTAAAERKLHVAQPSLSRQMRDLERELGVTLMLRSARGIELTASGRAFLDHARLVLLQLEVATEAARRAAEPSKTSFALGFLTGCEIEWLQPVMRLLRHELANVEIAIQSKSSPELAAALVRGKLDLAFLRPEKHMPSLTYKVLRREPLVVVMLRQHRLAAAHSIRPADIAGETLIGVPTTTAPVLREVTDIYAARVGLDLTPDHEAENLSMAFSLTASTGGVALLPLFAKNLLPPSIVSRPLVDPQPTIDLVLGYDASNPSPLLKLLLSRLKEVNV